MPSSSSITQPRPLRADYTGLVIAQNSRGQNILYAADFHNNKIDMFDGGFHSLGSFTDPKRAGAIPGPYRLAGGRPERPALGHLCQPQARAVRWRGGHLRHRRKLADPEPLRRQRPRAGPLENPWGIVQAPANFGAFSNDILIGNVEGDGNINAFDPATGAFLGQFQHPDGTPIAIPGLWDLTFGGGSPDNGLSKQLYFDAGPNVPNPAGNGLFGRIIAAGNQGNGQGAGTDGAAVLAAKSAIVGLAPLPSATATGPQATAYGWLIDIAPIEQWCLHDARPPGQEQQDRLGDGARGMSPASNSRDWCSVGAGVDHLAPVAGGEGLVHRESRPADTAKDPDPVRGGIDRDPGRVPGGRVDSPAVDRLLQGPDRPVDGREVAAAGV